jgi:hypothetical protein
VGFQNVREVTDEKSGFLGVDPLRGEPLEKALKEACRHATLSADTTNHPKSNNRLKTYSALVSLVRVMTAFLVSFPFCIEIESFTIPSS